MPGLNLTHISININSTIKTALEKIDRNAKGVCFIVDDQNILSGMVTDGDLRRAILNGAALDDQVVDIMNTSFIAMNVKSDDSSIINKLSDRIKVIPLVDEDNVLVDYATYNKIRKIPIAYPLLGGNELNYVTECVKTSWISSQGKFVKRFESQFAAQVGHPEALAVSNGTVAIHLALVALGIGPGDQVIVPNLTFAATINAVLYTGATPVIVDVNSVDWNIDYQETSRHINSKTKAIIPVHLYGHPYDPEPFIELAKKNHLYIIEDCAEALGSRYHDKHVGYYADISTFSFFGNKTITTGEGGMIVFKDPEVAQRAAILRDHGMSKSKRYWHEVIGYNYRMTNIQAALGVAQMERLDEILSIKRKIGYWYGRYLKNVRGVQLPPENNWAYHSYWLYTILFDTVEIRDYMINFLMNNGVETRPVFYPLNQMPPYGEFSFSDEHYSISVELSARGLSLPSSIDLDEEVIQRIAETIEEGLILYS